MSMMWVFSTHLLLQLAPDRVRGRIFSTEFALFTLFNAMGTAAGGWLLDTLSIPIALALWGTSGLTLAIGGLWIGLGLLETSDGDQSSPASPSESEL
jgi:hypothetical protein